jgi:hypothetical protein
LPRGQEVAGSGAASSISGSPTFMRFRAIFSARYNPVLHEDLCKYTRHVIVEG